MGTLRFFLALSVAYGHLGAFLGFSLIRSDIAVECFFVISGFYMSLVLNGKYADARYWTFISNRLLRLYPVYFIVLIATLFFTKQHWPPIDLAGSIYFAVSQLTLFGQDGYLFFAIDKGSLVTTADFAKASGPLWKFAPIPQAWSLGIELWFYLLAPFLLRRSKSILITAFLISIALRLFLQYALGLGHDPWSYRFFPSELALFLLGTIANRMDRKSLIACTAIIVIALLINNPYDLQRTVAIIFLACAAISIPWLFERTKNIALDRFLGELSYPIYIVHVFMGHFAGSRLALLLTIVCSVLLHLLIEKPIDRWRQSRLASTRRLAFS